jgi:hypothetical protein
MITSEQAAPEVQRAIDAEDVFHISSLLSISHELCETWVHADTVMYEVQIIHERRDGSLVTLPCVDISG